MGLFKIKNRNWIKELKPVAGLIKNKHLYLSCLQLHHDKHQLIKRLQKKVIFFNFFGDF